MTEYIPGVKLRSRKNDVTVVMHLGQLCIRKRYVGADAEIRAANETRARAAYASLVGRELTLPSHESPLERRAQTVQYYPLVPGQPLSNSRPDAPRILADALARLWSLRMPRCGYYPFVPEHSKLASDWKRFLAADVERLGRIVESSGSRLRAQTISTMEALTVRLRDAVPSLPVPSGYVVCHGDLKFSNCVICPDGQPILIDLEYAISATPALCLSRLYVDALAYHNGHLHAVDEVFLFAKENSIIDLRSVLWHAHYHLVELGARGVIPESAFVAAASVLSHRSAALPRSLDPEVNE